MLFYNSRSDCCIKFNLRFSCCIEFYNKIFSYRADTDVTEGDTVHIIGEFNESGHCEINDHQNMIIVKPDLLVSGTTVVSTVHCMRR